MKTTIKLSDFYFKFKGHGRYEVTYTCPRTFKEWKCETTDMMLVDDTKSEDYPTKSNLMTLKKRCKKG